MKDIIERHQPSLLVIHTYKHKLLSQEEWGKMNRVTIIFIYKNPCSFAINWQFK